MTEKYMNLKEQIVVRIEYDDCAESPRSWCNLGTLYCWTRGYISPDECKYPDAISFLEEILGESIVSKVHDKYTNTRDFMEEIVERMDRAGYILYPVSLFDHSGTRYFLGCASGWDVGTVGVMFASKEKIREELGCKKITKAIREKVKGIFEGELETYTEWANGYVYGYIVEDLAGNEVDSCWGFMGYNIYDEEKVFDMVNGNWNIGNKEDFEKFDEERILEKFEIKTVVTAK